ncbi:DUF4142 domain-containing protein [Pedobacter boryungensis]|uniref:DUF4142 domain-containing protein n=1 Tax=Pedobacter boryungensis TaxID=869962 RepID=A0ABX2DFV2_9SPHI|nr:DUF4142 domain-containing protein [Pedobacter boryungensis]NQX32971.1 DUF4142 domain-containing protein [Pedobacter boryungensis]
MKKLGYLSVIALLAFTFQSCNSNSKDSNANTDSLNQAMDTTMNADTTGAMATTEDDREFAGKAAVGGMAEVEFGKIALSKSTNAEVKAFADMMVNDHGKANAELKTIATSKNMALPTSLDEEHTKKMNDLNKLTGRDFDKEYVNAMVDGHKKTLDLMEKEAKDGKDAELRAFASKTAPIVKAHLDKIQKISDSMK